MQGAPPEQSHGDGIGHLPPGVVHFDVLPLVAQYQPHPLRGQLPLQTDHMLNAVPRPRVVAPADKAGGQTVTQPHRHRLGVQAKLRHALRRQPLPLLAQAFQAALRPGAPDQHRRHHT